MRIFLNKLALLITPSYKASVKQQTFWTNALPIRAAARPKRRLILEERDAR
jgi:hypothetical protein